jgi:hypothetical protein
MKLLPFAKDIVQQGAAYSWKSEAEDESILQAHEILAHLKQCLSDWKLGTHNGFGKSCANIVSILIAIGFFPDAGDEDESLDVYDKKSKETHRRIKCGPFTLFKAKVWDVQEHSPDFVTMVLDTLLFFLERGLVAFQHGDLSLMLFDSNEAAEAEKEYALLMSALPLLEVGKLADFKIGTVKGIQDEFEFDSRLEALYARFSYKLKETKNPHEVSVISNKILGLTRLRTALITAQRESPVRAKPYGLLVYGGSGVGKTGITNYLGKTILQSNDIPCSKNHVVTVNDLDKFNSECKPRHTWIQLDDLAQGTERCYRDHSPTQMIIDFLNNVVKAALNAEAHLKGIMILKMRLVTVTTNRKDLMSGIFSNEPGAVMRRFETILDVRLKPGWTDPDTGIFDANKAKREGVRMPDAWDIDIQQVKIIRGAANGNKRPGKQPAGADTWDFRTVKANASIFEVQEYLINDSKDFYEDQDEYVKKTEELFDQPLCPHMRFLGECPHGCMHSPSENESVDMKSEMFFNPISEAEENLTRRDIDKIAAELEEDDPIADSVEMFADWYVQRKINRITGYCKNAFKTLGEAFLAHKKEILLGTGSVAALAGVAYLTRDMWLTGTQMREMFSQNEEKCKPTLEQIHLGNLVGVDVKQFTPKELDAFFKGHPDSVSASEFEKKLTPMLPPYLKPSDDMQIPQGTLPVPDKEVLENPWKRLKCVEIPYQKSACAAQESQVRQKMEWAITSLLITDNETGATRRVNMIPIAKSYWLAPNHVFTEDKVYSYSGQMTSRKVLGRNSSGKIGPTEWFRFPEKDLILLSLPGFGPAPRFEQFLPEKEPQLVGTNATLVYKNKDGEAMSEHIKNVRSKSGVVTPRAKFHGWIYNSPSHTFDGLCGAAVLTKTVPCILAGIHLAGTPDETTGAFSTFTKADYELARGALLNGGCIECHSEGSFITEKYGVDFTPIDKVDPRSPAHFMCEEDGKQPVVEVYGQHPLGTRHFRSNVRKSPISDSVTEIGIERLHGPPKEMNSYRHWQRDMALMAHPRGNFDPLIMRRARADLKFKIDDLLKRKPQIKDVVHPYARDAVLAGMDGVTAVDRIDLTTSVGWPLNKQKKLYIQESTDKVIEGITAPLECDEMFWEEAEKMEKILASGERIYTVFRGNLKDEPTKFTKDKVRVFAGCELAFLLVVRKYYLPLIRVIQDNWLDFECAVGIVAQSNDWSKFVEHQTKHGMDRCMAGDYAAYDKRMSPVVMMAAFEQLCDVAEQCGYTKEALMIMRGIATEISFPIYEFNGILMQIFGSNPSGHPLTVIINNLCNSLYMRYAYYVLHPEENAPSFSDVVALVCYGDDNHANISDKEHKFHHTSVSNILRELGIEYTMADKTSESIPLVPFLETEFLKRGFLWSDELGEWLAPLDVRSIAKSLHNYMHRKGSPAEPRKIAADAVFTACTEFWRHGPEVFAEMRPKLQQVIDAHELHEHIAELPTHSDMKDAYQNMRVKRKIEKQPDTSFMMC